MPSRMTASLRVGLDFDNTIVSYDELFVTCALERGLVSPGVPRTKRAVRDAIRLLPAGNDLWTELQGLVYGHRILEATPAPGLEDFLHHCHQRGVEVLVISHKTLHPAAGPSWNLHDAARAWLAHHLPPGPRGVSPSQVFFELTLGEKLARIRDAGCTHFVDDLEEVLTHPAFPPGVVRILYEPARLGSPPPLGVTPCRRWSEVGHLVLSPASPATAQARVDAGVRLLEAGSGTTVREATPLRHGANSTVHRLETREGHVYALKLYPEGPRGEERLAREFSVLRFLWGNGVRQVPEPVAHDLSHRIAVYGFLEGTPVAAGSIGASEVEEACAFLASLQELRDRPGARRLAQAAEACFSLEAHVRLVEARVARLEERLSSSQAAATVTSEARALVEGRLRPLLGVVARWMAEQASSLGLPFERELPEEMRVISPSDFGFHNILRGAEGRLGFVDFEHAGWDDMAKTLTDFHHQPERPVPASLRPLAVRVLSDAAGAQARRTGRPSWFEGAATRAALLHPLLGLKWCLIMLNVFLALPASPAGSGTTPPPDPQQQLLRATEKFEEVESTWRRGVPCLT